MLRSVPGVDAVFCGLLRGGLALRNLRTVLKRFCESRFVRIKLGGVSDYDRCSVPASLPVQGNAGLPRGGSRLVRDGRSSACTRCGTAMNSRLCADMRRSVRMRSVAVCWGGVPRGGSPA